MICIDQRPGRLTDPAAMGAARNCYFPSTGCFPYFGVPLLEEPFASAYRWHIPDPVPFRKSLRFLIEHGNGAPPFKSNNYYYSVAYWYQTEPHAPFPKLPTPAERVAWDSPQSKTSR